MIVIESLLYGSISYLVETFVTDSQMQEHSVSGLLINVIKCAILAVTLVVIYYLFIAVITYILDLLFVSARYSDRFLNWLNRGKNNNTVYFAKIGDEYVYTGITRQNVFMRLAQHRYYDKPFDGIEPIVTDLTRNQARAIEQYFIENGPNFFNRINSISPNNEFYD